MSPRVFCEVQFGLLVALISIVVVLLITAVGPRVVMFRMSIWLVVIRLCVRLWEWVRF